MQKIIIKKWEKYGRLTIIKEIESVWNRRYFKCQCECWNIKNIQMGHFRWWHIISCWCYAKEKQKEQWKKSVLNMIATLTTHWMSRTRFYRIYNALNNRCNYLKYPEFKYYWWRWIKNKWNSFENFRDDMYESYLKHCEDFWEKETTIDRINSNWNYCKENCRWATYKEQNENKRVKNWYRLDWTHPKQKIFKKELNYIKKELKKWKTWAQIAKDLWVYKSCIYFNIKKHGLK